MYVIYSVISDGVTYTTFGRHLGNGLITGKHVTRLCHVSCEPVVFCQLRYCGPLTWVPIEHFLQEVGKGWIREERKVNWFVYDLVFQVQHPFSLIEWTDPRSYHIKGEPCCPYICRSSAGLTRAEELGTEELRGPYCFRFLNYIVLVFNGEAGRVPKVNQYQLILFI